MKRAEENRVAHLVRGHVDARDDPRTQAQVARQEELLGRMLQSSALGLAEKLSNLKQRGNPIFTRQEIQDLTLDSNGPLIALRRASCGRLVGFAGADARLLFRRFLKILERARSVTFQLLLVCRSWSSRSIASLIR